MLTKLLIKTKYLNRNLLNVRNLLVNKNREIYLENVMKRQQLADIVIESNKQNDGETHFGYETVKESEKAEKGLPLFLIL